MLIKDLLSKVTKHYPVSSVILMPLDANQESYVTTKMNVYGKLLLEIQYPITVSLPQQKLDDTDADDTINASIVMSPVYIEIILKNCDSLIEDSSYPTYLIKDIMIGISSLELHNELSELVGKVLTLNTDNDKGNVLA